jgi:hypothetical protein
MLSETALNKKKFQKSGKKIVVFIIFSFTKKVDSEEYLFEINNN